MLANPTGLEFLGTLSKFRKRNKMSSLLVYVLHKGPVIIYRLGVGDFCCDNWALTWSPLKGYSVVLTPPPPIGGGRLHDSPSLVIWYELNCLSRVTLLIQIVENKVIVSLVLPTVEFVLIFFIPWFPVTFIFCTTRLVCVHKLFDVSVIMTSNSFYFVKYPTAVRILSGRSQVLLPRALTLNFSILPLSIRVFHLKLSVPPLTSFVPQLIEKTMKNFKKPQKCDAHPELWLCVVKVFFFDVLVAVASLDLSFDRCSQWGGSFDGWRLFSEKLCIPRVNIKKILTSV